MFFWFSLFLIVSNVLAQGRLIILIVRYSLVLGIRGVVDLQPFYPCCYRDNGTYGKSTWNFIRDLDTRSSAASGDPLATTICLIQRPFHLSVILYVFAFPLVSPATLGILSELFIIIILYSLLLLYILLDF